LSVQFPTYRPGTGKTALCRQRIIAACKADALGPPICRLVPRQATFQTQRDLRCSTELKHMFRVRVLSFDDLCRQVVAEVGGAVAPEVSHAGRRPPHRPAMARFSGGAQHRGFPRSAIYRGFLLSVSHRLRSPANGSRGKRTEKTSDVVESPK
jgi:hypothetical protein